MLRDDRGHHYPLREGTNILGRGHDSDVILAPCYGTVSRRHLVVEIADERLVWLTDFSSKGTFIPTQRMDASLGYVGKIGNPTGVWSSASEAKRRDRVPRTRERGVT